MKTTEGQRRLADPSKRRFLREMLISGSATVLAVPVALMLAGVLESAAPGRHRPLQADVECMRWRMQLLRPRPAPQALRNHPAKMYADAGLSPDARAQGGTMPSAQQSRRMKEIADRCRATRITRGVSSDP